MVFFCCYLFVSYTHGIFCSFHDLQTFQGWAGKKAASLWTVYCSGFSHGVIVIKKQKAKTRSSQTKEKAKRAHQALPNRHRKHHRVHGGVWLEPARACFPVLI